MSALSPLEKLHKRERDNLSALCNRISSAFNFKTCRTWRDVYRMEGLSNDAITAQYNGTADKNPTLLELRAHFAQRKSELEDRLVGKVKPVQVPVQVPVQQAATTPTTKETDESGIANDGDYGLHSSPKEKAKLFWFQKKATVELWKGIIGK